jgi:hypothetical protein
MNVITLPWWTGSPSRFAIFAAQYPARRCPYLRFDDRLATTAAKRGQNSSPLLSGSILSFPTRCRFDPGARTLLAHCPGAMFPNWTDTRSEKNDRERFTLAKERILECLVSLMRHV